MAKELLDNEIVEEMNEVEVYDDYADDSKGVGATLVKVGLVGVAALGLAVGYKCKDKISAFKDNRAAKRLEKKGYSIVDPNYCVQYDEAEIIEDLEELDSEDK